MFVYYNGINSLLNKPNEPVRGRVPLDYYTHMAHYKACIAGTHRDTPIIKPKWIDVRRLVAASGHCPIAIGTRERLNNKRYISNYMKEQPQMRFYQFE